jgi:hypothetical protein
MGELDTSLSREACVLKYLAGVVYDTITRE